MIKLSADAKQAMVLKALNQKDRTVKEIAASHNVGYSTLQKWIKKHRDDAKISNKASVNQLPSRADQFKHILATAGLDEVAVGVYCREHGLYNFQINQWKELFMKQNSTEKNHAEQTELKALRAENKQLKQDIRRKDRALAETAALLVLKKKASLIWGEREDD